MTPHPLIEKQKMQRETERQIEMQRETERKNKERMSAMKDTYLSRKN